jgi:hypothetical protein
MVENLKRVREPAAWAMLAVIVGFMVLNIVRLVWVLTHDQLPVFTAFSDIASNSMSLTLAALQVALVCLCLFVSPATGRSVALARASALVVSLGTVLTIVATAIGLWANKGVMGVVFELLGGVLDIVLKVLAAIILWVILRAVRTGRMQTPVPPATPEPELLHALTDEAPPVWQPAQAAGTVWKTAAEAAAGTTAAGTIPPAPTASTGEGSSARGAWAANPQPRPGAADALGWHRVTDPGPTSTADAG